MRIKHKGTIVLAGSLLLAPVAGCESLPGSAEQQGAVGGGAGGAATGAVLAGEGNRLVGALLGGVLGAGGGYLIGSETGKIDSGDQGRDEAQKAVKNAQNDPATVADVREAATADLNEDGFVTADEIVAMAEADLRDDQMIERLRATDQVFELNQSQQQYLNENGVSEDVIEQMERINQTDRDRLLDPRRRSDDTGQDVLGDQR